MNHSQKVNDQASSLVSAPTSAPDSDQTTRRSFLEQSAQVSLALGAMSLVGAKSAFARDGQSLSPSAEPGDRHFFFHIQISSGVDVQYTFDSRPLDMTAKKLIANYHGQEPILYTGSNGQSTYRTSLTDPLMKWSDRFSIVNGVVMSPSFDGHDQGTNILFTGSPFGGDSYLPWANTKNTALDYVESGFVFASVTNNSGAMSLDPKSCKALALRVGELGRQGRTLTALGRRAERAGIGKSSLAQSSRLMSKAIGNVPAFAQSFSAVQLTEPMAFDPNNLREKLLSETKSNVEMFTELMRTGITDNALMSINLEIDAHDMKTAQSLTTKLPAIAEALALVFEQLSVTPSPSGRSMLEDTTILIGTEFARTMRQSYNAFEKTGTDHNPLTNTLIIGG
ncbi:MAG: DUF1501 domain-containing protein, partial [Proteobacteria bacterium]|nr:DUF1501 domain-containing protein [Pseudomonadota bacterium]